MIRRDFRLITWEETERRFNNIWAVLKYGFKNFRAGHVEYTPAHRRFEIVLSNTMRVLSVYDKRNDVTYINIFNRGMIGDILPMDPDEVGVLLKLRGNKINDIINNDIVDEAFDYLYKEERKRIESYRYK